MRVYLVPYEQMYLSVMLNMDEATEVSDALELLKSLRKTKELSPSVEKLQQLLANSISKAVSYQIGKGS